MLNELGRFWESVKTLAALLGAIFIGGMLQADQVSLAWDPNSEADLAGYRVHIGGISGNYDQVQDVGLDTTWTVTGLASGTTYFFVVTAYDTAGLESDPSNEIRYDVPAAAAAPDSPPTALAAHVTLAEDATVAITLQGTDPDGDALTFSVGQLPSHGTLSGTPPNLSYRPVANFNGADAFMFTVNDGRLTSAPATVTLTVQPVNDPPVAYAQSLAMAEDTALTVILAGSDRDGDALTYSVAQPPAHGALSGTPPNLTYHPAANFNGSDAFTFTVNDGKATSTSATVSLTVQAVNDSPVVFPQSLATAEDTALAIVLAGSDVDGNALTFAISVPPSHGTLSGTPPNLTYHPAANFNGADAFAFTASDGQLTSAPATVTLSIQPVNDAPVAHAQSLTASEDTALAIVLAGSDVDGNALTFAISVPPSHGTLSGTPPNLTYHPAANFNGADAFAFTASDGQLTSAPATVTLSIQPVNDAPVAHAQSLTTSEDTALAIVLAGSDVDGNALTFAISVPPSHGTLSGTPPNLIYHPAANFRGTDAFSFTASDGQLTSAPATVDVTVQPVNDAPVAVAQTLATAEDTALAIVLAGSDVDGNALTFAVRTPPSHGTLSGTPPNLTYHPAANFRGTDAFSFTASDGQLTSAPATVDVTVQPVNDAPVAVAQTLATAEDTALAIVLAGSDVDGNALTFAVRTPPSHGTLSGTPPNLTYHPAANFNGADAFAFTANDGQLTSAPATVTLNIQPVNDAPVAHAQSLTASEDTALAIVLAGSDVDGNALTFAISVPPSHGTLSGTPPNLTYHPAANFRGTDAFSFTASDGQLTSAPATVDVTVQPVNDAPVAVAQTLATAEDTALAIVLAGSDVDSNALTFAVRTPPSHGTLSGTPPNLIYRPAANFTGADAFTFTAFDGQLTSAPATVTLVVNAVVAPPTILPDSLVVNQGGSASRLQDGAASVLKNDGNGGASMSAVLMRPPAHGQLLLNLDGTFRYTHDGGQETEDSFTYKAQGSHTVSSETTVTISVFRALDMWRSSTDLRFSFSTQAGTDYEVQYNHESPAPGASWQSFTGRIAGVPGSLVVADGAPGDTVYYRVICYTGGGTLITEPVGLANLSIHTGYNPLAASFHTFPSFVGSITAVGPDSIAVGGQPWKATQFDPKDGFVQCVLMVRQAGAGSSAADGDWWPILATGTDTLQVETRGRDLGTELAVGDRVEVRQLTSCADLLGTGGAADDLIATDESVLLFNEPPQQIQVVFRDSAAFVRGYYYAVNGVSHGPVDGSTVTIYPGGGGYYRRNGASAIRPVLGRVHTFGLTHYAPTSLLLSSSPYPVPAPLATAGLLEAGWMGDLGGAVPKDWIQVFNPGNASLFILYSAVSGLPTGWNVNGQMDDSVAFAPGQSQWLVLAPRSDPFRWRQPVPWGK